MGLGSDRRVLVVEDEPLSAALVRVLLEELGCHVTLAATGAEAVRFAKEEAFSLILMDFFLPDLSGLEAVAIIRAQTEVAASRHAPVVALTASDRPDDHRACLDAGMNDYILKPIDSEALRHLLVKWGVLGSNSREHMPSDPPPPIGDFDPRRITELREILDAEAFTALIIQAFSSLQEHLEAIELDLDQPQSERRALHRIVSLSYDLGFVGLGRGTRTHEEALALGQRLDKGAREAFWLLGGMSCPS